MVDTKTTFIPKKQMKPAGSLNSGAHTINPLDLVAWIIFLIAMLTTGGLYSYNAYLESRVASKISTIKESEELIDPVLITQIRQGDSLLKSAQTALDEHIALTPLFDFLEDTTLATVRFRSFNLSNKDGTYTITMPGEARSFFAVAGQSDTFKEDNIFKDFSFSNFKLDKFGDVNFDFSAVVKKSALLYRNTLAPEPSIVLPEPFVPFLPPEEVGEGDTNSVVVDVEGGTVNTGSLDFGQTQ